MTWLIFFSVWSCSRTRTERSFIPLKEGCSMRKGWEQTPITTRGRTQNRNVLLGREAPDSLGVTGYETISFVVFSPRFACRPQGLSKDAHRAQKASFYVLEAFPKLIVLFGKPDFFWNLFGKTVVLHNSATERLTLSYVEALWRLLGPSWREVTPGWFQVGSRWT